MRWAIPVDDLPTIGTHKLPAFLGGYFGGVKNLHVSMGCWGLREDYIVVSSICFFEILIHGKSPLNQHLGEYDRVSGWLRDYLHRRQILVVYLQDVFNLHTLQIINISHLGKRKIIFKMPFWGDMLVPWRVYLKLVGFRVPGSQQNLRGKNSSRFRPPAAAHPRTWPVAKQRLGVR